MYVTYPLLFAPKIFYVNALIFVGATLKKSTKNHYLAVFYSIKTYFLMTGKFEIWHVGFSSPLVCPCIISCHCIDFCGSQAQKGTKNCNFAVFCSIKTNFLMSGTLEIQNVPPLVGPCKNSCQCLNFCRSHAQKNLQKITILQYFTV